MGVDAKQLFFLKGVQCSSDVSIKNGDFCLMAFNWCSILICFEIIIQLLMGCQETFVNIQNSIKL